MQLHKNAFEHCRQITADLRIPEADHTISFLLEPKLPFAIALGGFVVIMMSAVEFNDQTLGWAEEVYDIGTDRCLASEVRAIYREFFQSAPQCALVWCRVGSESFGCRSPNQCRDHMHPIQG